MPVVTLHPFHNMKGKQKKPIHELFLITFTTKTHARIKPAQIHLYTVDLLPAIKGSGHKTTLEQVQLQSKSNYTTILVNV